MAHIWVSLIVCQYRSSIEIWFSLRVSKKRKNQSLWIAHIMYLRATWRKMGDGRKPMHGTVNPLTSTHFFSQKENIACRFVLSSSWPCACWWRHLPALSWWSGRRSTPLMRRRKVGRMGDGIHVFWNASIMACCYTRHKKSSPLGKDQYGIRRNTWTNHAIVSVHDVMTRALIH